MSAPSRSPDRLGLALAGGGFRAALFHVGVLRRLAELDLLRRVHVLSTVSGGSIVGALYVLRLKRWLETYRRPLSGAEYRCLVQEVETMLCDGIRKNLRTRLLLNPLTTLRVMLTPFSLGQAMARLYERHIFARALDPPGQGTIPGAPPPPPPPPPARKRPHLWRRRPILLSELRIDLPEVELSGGVDAYNAHEVTEHGSAVTRIVLNATSLNSGGRFLFSAVEVGDYYLGHFRIDEFPALRARKALLLQPGLDALLARGSIDPLPDAKDARAVVELAAWWQQHVREGDAPLSGSWAALAQCFPAGVFPGDLAEAPLGALRQAKVAAWYMRYAPDGVTGGRSPSEHWETIATAMADIDPQLGGALDGALPDPPLPSAQRDLFLEFLVELYRIRSAEHMSKRFDRDWQKLTVGDAVGASACFPPVFPPFSHLGIYDDACASRLGLTDGGVYDNMGVVALLDEGCTSIIASDTGGLFKTKVEAPADQLRMSLRIPDVLMRAVAGFQRGALRERRRISRAAQGIGQELALASGCGQARAHLEKLRSAHELRALAYFHMASPRVEPAVGPPALRFPVDAGRLAHLRTDLDGFSGVEIAALVNHGYETADRYVRRYLGEGNEQAWAKAEPQAPPLTVGGARVDRIIAAGASRFLRALKLRVPLSMGAILVGLFSLLVLALDRGTNLLGLWQALAGWIAGLLAGADRALGALPAPVAATLRWLATAIPRHLLPWLRQLAGDSRTLALVAGVAGLALAAFWAIPAPRQRNPRRFVWLHTAWKWTSGFSGNVLWAVWLLPLFLVAALTCLAGVSWVVFFLPWRRAARIRPEDIRPAISSAQEPVRAQPAPGDAAQLQPR